MFGLMGLGLRRLNYLVKGSGSGWEGIYIDCDWLWRLDGGRYHWRLKYVWRYCLYVWRWRY